MPIKRNCTIKNIAIFTDNRAAIGNAGRGNAMPSTNSTGTADIINTG